MTKTKPMTKKQSYKFDKWKIILIKWVDSMTSSGWQHEDNIDLDDKYIYKESVGFFYKETDEAITIAQNKDDDGEPKQNVAAIMTIPKVAIKSIKEINQ